jgi:hypothetical protein
MVAYEYSSLNTVRVFRPIPVSITYDDIAK